jgi:hypothetical protein
MAGQQFHVEATNQEVSVRMDAGRTRFYALSFFVTFTILVICALLFLPGKRGHPSMWQDLSTSSVASAYFWVKSFLLLSFPVFMVLTTKRYVRLAYPSDEAFRCDRSTLSISRVRWLDVRNRHWDTHSYSLADVREIRYAVVTRLRGYSIYGLRFDVRGKTQKILPDLKPSDAEKALIALKAFGADVPADPLVPSKPKEDTSA